MQSRRLFIKNTCAACIGMSMFGLLAESCLSNQAILKSEILNNKIEVPLSKFLTEKAIIVSNKNLDYHILVTKKNEQFIAVQMRCTHNDVALTYSGSKLICSSHGSEFGTNGEVMKDPATRNLKTYTTTIEQDKLYIHIKE